MASEGGSNEIKSMIFLILLGVGVFFGYKWYLKNDKASEERIKKLESEYTKLQSKKDSSDIKIAAWHSKFDSIRGEDIILKNQVEHLSKQLLLQKLLLQNQKQNLKQQKRTQNHLEQILIS